jgi:hypothetical protein
MWELHGIGLLADLPAHPVFLLIEDALLGFGDMAAILASHTTLFLANLVIFPVELARLLWRDFAFLDFLVDAVILVRQPPIDLFPAGMILLPFRFRQYLSRGARSDGSHEGHANDGLTREHLLLRQHACLLEG